MPENDDPKMIRLAYLLKHGTADDLDELAKLLGQTHPWTPPPPVSASMDSRPPGRFARILAWFRRRRNTDPQAKRSRRNRPTSTS